MERATTICGSNLRHARDAPRLISHRDNASDNDRAEGQHRADRECRDAGQALADRTTERGDAAESHQYTADDMVRGVFSRRKSTA